MRSMVRHLLERKDLLYILTWKEIRIRYKQSVMGFLWAVLMPILIVGTGMLVRKAFSMVSGTSVTMDDLLSVSVKAVPWAFFVGAIRFGAASFVANSNLVTKVYFPREILPLSCVLANFFDFAIAAAFLALIMLVTRAGFSIHLLWLPVMIVLLFLITASVALLLACANLFYRDVKYLIEVVITFGILVTPVFYSARIFGKWATLLLLNPVGAILESINDIIVLHRSPSMFWLAYVVLCAVGGSLIAWTIFAKAEPAFAEEI